MKRVNRATRARSTALVCAALLLAGCGGSTSTHVGVSYGAGYYWNDYDDIFYGRPPGYWDRPNRPKPEHPIAPAPVRPTPLPARPLPRPAPRPMPHGRMR